MKLNYSPKKQSIEIHILFDKNISLEGALNEKLFEGLQRGRFDSETVINDLQNANEILQVWIAEIWNE